MLTVSSKPKAPLVDAGLHEAVCYSVVDIGTHSSRYQGKIIRNRQIVLTWEIPGQRIQVEDRNTGVTKDLPRAISRTYTASLDPKATLRAHLVSWRSRGFTPEEEKAFEMKNVLGASCFLSIIHKPKQDGTEKAEVNMVLNLKGKRLKPQNPLVYYGIEENDEDIPASLPDWIVEQIKSSEEWQAMFTGTGEPPADETSPNDDGMGPEPTPEDADLPF
ncbi:MAG: hypothetical protein V2A79_10260 [Planctomycetota bacterium]